MGEGKPSIWSCLADQIHLKTRSSTPIGGLVSFLHLSCHTMLNPNTLRQRAVFKNLASPTRRDCHMIMHLPNNDKLHERFLFLFHLSSVHST